MRIQVVHSTCLCVGFCKGRDTKRFAYFFCPFEGILCFTYSNLGRDTKSFAYFFLKSKILTSISFLHVVSLPFPSYYLCEYRDKSFAYFFCPFEGILGFTYSNKRESLRRDKRIMRTKDNSLLKSSSYFKGHYKHR